MGTSSRLSLARRVCGLRKLAERSAPSPPFSPPRRALVGRQFVICALAGLAGAICLSGCGGRSILSPTCKVPLEAKTSSGSVVPIGTCGGLLGSGVAHVALHPGESVEIVLLQLTGFGTIEITDSNSRDLRALPAPDALGALEDYVATRQGSARLLAMSRACPRKRGTQGAASCLIAVVHVT